MFRRSVWQFIFFLSFNSTLFCLPTVVLDPVHCVEELEQNFFQSRVVFQSLSLHEVRQELWVPIIQLLQVKSREIPDRIKRKTAFMVPNPFEYPMNKRKAEKILKQVLYEVFVDTMRFYNNNGQPQMDLVFNDIFEKRETAWKRCFSSFPDR